MPITTRRPMKLPLRRLAAALLCTSAAAAHAVDRADGDDGPAGVLESTRESVRAASEWVARGVYCWFGVRRFYDGGMVTNGRLELRSSWRRDDGFDFALRFSARFELPNLRERAYVFIGRDNEREVVTDKPDAFSRQEQLLRESRRDDQSFFAGLGLPVGDDVEFRVGVRRGYRLYTQARYTKAWPLSERDRVVFRETLYWTLIDGFGSTTAVSAERVLAPNLELRWLTSGTFAQKTDGLAWSSSVGLYKAFARDRLLSGEMLVNGETGRDVGVADYGLRARWLQPVYQDWLLGEFIVGHFWPRESAATSRERTWAFGLGVQMRF